MRDATGGAPPRRFGVWLAFLTTGLLSSCGSDSAVSPTPTPSPSPPAFVHMLDRGQPGRPYEQVLWTFKADPRTGELSVVDTKAVPNDSFSPLAADPRGRFVYVSERPASLRWDSILAYRVDRSTGALTLASEVQSAVFAAGDPAALAAGSMWVSRLAAASTHLYVGGGMPQGYEQFYCLGVLPVGDDGLSAEGRLLAHDYYNTSGFWLLHGVDGGRDVAYAGYAETEELRALTLAPAAAPPYREVARLRLHELGIPAGSARNLAAADGRVFFTDEEEWFFSYVANEATGTFDERGRVPKGGRVRAVGAGGRLAVVPPSIYVQYGPEHFFQATTRIVLYQVGADGAVSPLSGLPESYFQADPTLVFHPSGSFLYACGIPASGSPQGSVRAQDAFLLTFSVGADGSLTPAGSLPVARCGEMVATSPGS